MGRPDRRQRRQRPIPPRTTPLPPSPTSTDPHEEAGAAPILAPTATPVDLDALTRVGEAEQVRHHVGQCTRPVQLAGRRPLVEASTGRIVDQCDTGHPIGVRCRNRRRAVCPACSALYRLDAFHVFAAGLRGGKDTPAQVADHPRLFVTLTAPSFGLVHLGAGRDGSVRRCHPRRGCGRWHTIADPAIGTALDPGGYNYPGQVLFNAHIGQLWARFTIDVRRHLAATASLTRSAAAKQMRVVFAKVAEFQTRGVVHLHAIVRLDGPDGPGSPPPVWATARRLETAIRAAATRVQVATPDSRVAPPRSLRWGRQLDIRRIGGNGVSDTAVAGYVAKYATKSTEAAGIDIPPLFCRTCAGRGITIRTGGRLCRTCAGTGRRRDTALDPLTPHVRALVETCWRLGGQPQYAELRLRRWAHQLGFHGHFATKSRGYSTTFTALRAERRTWSNLRRAEQCGLPAGTPLLVVDDWRYTGRPDTGREWSA
jgi:hypothetical protein